MSEWLLLTASLPTSPSALRVRVWRALKATGCGLLRDGVYLLPRSAATAQALWDIERTIADNGSDAHLLVVPARDDAQEQAFRALFDRTDAYAEFLQSVKEARDALRDATEQFAHKTLRTLDAQLQALHTIDFFPGAEGERAATALAALRREVDQRLSPGEPAATGPAIERLDAAAYQGRIWATRARPWVDRLATAWLVTRFIDRAPTFVWLDDIRRCPAHALGYDFDGATFTHVGDRVTFEVVAHAFGLDAEPAIARLGELVHAIDVGGIPLDDAPGFETVMRGLQALHGEDDALLGAALSVFDAVHAAMKDRSA